MSKKYSIGDKVWWNDPDGDTSSGRYNVDEVHEDFLSISNDFSEAEVPYHEVTLIK